MATIIMITLAIGALYVSVRFSGAVLAIIAGTTIIMLSGGLFWAMLVAVSHLFR